MTMTSSSLTGIAIAAALMLASCADNAQPRSADIPSVPDTSEVEMSAPANDLAVEAEAPMSVALNPAHGEPGHRCEIPVGAPLDGSGESSTTVMPPTANPVIAPPVTSPAFNSGMLNPAHGEPGHDCAVPVGSPLPG